MTHRSVAVTDCCWHPTGISTGNRAGGAREHQCCYCGTYANAMYRNKHVRIKGHGPKVTVVDEVITTTLPKVICDVR